jgi:hypothetical protein
MIILPVVGVITDPQHPTRPSYATSGHDRRVLFIVSFSVLHGIAVIERFIRFALQVISSPRNDFFIEWA